MLFCKDQLCSTVYGACQIATKHIGHIRHTQMSYGLSGVFGRYFYLVTVLVYCSLGLLFILDAFIDFFAMN